MMHSPFKNLSRILCGSLFALSLMSCTSSQTNSVDDEMLSETAFSDEEVAEPSAGAEESLDFSEEDFASEPTEENLELDFEDFDSENQKAQNQADDFQDFELDELKAEDVVQTEEPAPLPMDPPVEELDLGPDLDAPVADLDFEEPATPVSSSPTQISDIRYLSNQAGGSVVIDANQNFTYETRFNPETGQYVIEVQNATLPERLKRPYVMKDFSGSFGGLNAYQSPGENNVRVVVQLKPGFRDEPVVQMEGNSLVVVPPSGSASSFMASNQTNPPPASSGPLEAGSLEEFILSNQKFYGKPISLQVRDADVRDVIGFIAEESGANIIMSDEVKGNISLKLRKVPWDQALVLVMRSKGLGYVRQSNVIRVASVDELRKESRNAQEFLRARQELAPIRVKVIPVNYANVDSLNVQVKEFLSKEGKVVVDARSNSILVADREDVLDKITRLIQALDIQPNQVLIEGKIVEASEEFTSQVGVNWGFTGSALTLSQAGGANGLPIELTPNLGIGRGASRLANSLGVRLGTLDFLGNLDALLNLAESDRTAKIISSPQVVTMNREQAQIGQTGEVISTVSIESEAGNISTSESRQPVNLKLTVTPQITADGSVIMDMDVIRQFAGPVAVESTQSRPINTRSAKTKVLVKNGETAVIGGIYQVDEANTESGVPVLKDIPVLGWLFKSQDKSKAKNELLIFLTPRILAAGESQSSAAL